MSAARIKLSMELAIKTEVRLMVALIAGEDDKVFSGFPPALNCIDSLPLFPKSVAFS